MRVVDRQHRAARIAENVLDPLIQQRLDHHLGAGHLGSWLAPVFGCLGSAFGQQKRAPEGPCTHRLVRDGSQPPPAVRATTTIRMLRITGSNSSFPCAALIRAPQRLRQAEFALRRKAGKRAPDRDLVDLKHARLVADQSDSSDARPQADPSGPTTVGAYEAKTKFSELIARAEKGESFVVTKNGRPVARIAPPVDFDREKARKAVAALARVSCKSGAAGFRAGSAEELGGAEARAGCRRRRVG